MKRYIMALASVSAVVVVLVLILLQNSQQPQLVVQPRKELQGLELHQKVNQLVSAGNFSEARSIIGSSDSKEARLLRAQVLMAERNYQQALDAYRKIETDFGSDKVTVYSIAQAAEMAGDKGTALDYYQKTIELTRGETDNPVRDAEVRQLERTIERLNQ